MPRVDDSPQEIRRERLAVSLHDLDRLGPATMGNLLQGRLDLVRIVRVDNEPVVTFVCDLLLAAQIVDIIRSNDREVGDSPARVYILRRESWSKLPSGAVLTETVGDQIILNPAVFPAVAVDVPPPAPRKVTV